MRLNEKKVEQWCRENNWTEPRQLNTGDWAAFPPEGFIETPLPENVQRLARSRSNGELCLDFLSILVLAISGLIVAVISIAISPLFLAAIVRRYRQRRSMS